MAIASSLISIEQMVSNHGDKVSGVSFYWIYSYTSILLVIYHRSRNFRGKKLSYDKFSCKRNFVGMTPYRISVKLLIVRANFRKINFCSHHRLQKYFYNANFQIYGSITHAYCRCGCGLGISIRWLCGEISIS